MYVQREKETVLFKNKAGGQQTGKTVDDKSFTWKSFDGVVGDAEIRLERLKCNNLSSDTISVIPTFFLM